MDWLTALMDLTGLTKEQRVMLMRIGWVSLVSGHIAWVCGWLTVAGLEPPFAHANQLNELVTTVNEQRLEQIDREIQNVRAQQCRTATDSPARQNYTDRLNALYEKYQRLSHVSPRVPQCDET